MAGGLGPGLQGGSGHDHDLTQQRRELFRSSDNSGIWELDKKAITISYLVGGSRVATGTLDGDTMAGEYVDVDRTTGCWKASKISSTP